jgi:hypothetical protein
MSLAEKVEARMEEARGKLSTLIFGKGKGKKPKELTDTIRAFLNHLQVQQQQAAAAALLSPASQQLMNAVQQPNPGLFSPGGASTATTNSGGSSAAATPSNAGNPGVSVQTNAASNLLSPPGTGGSNLVSPSGQPAHSGISQLSIPSPMHGGVVLLGPTDGATVIATPGSTGSQAAAGGVAQTPNGTLVPQTPSVSSTSTSELTADLDQIVVLLYGDTSVDGASTPDPKAAKEVIELMFEHDLFRRLLENIRYLEFEARKFFTRIFEYAVTQRRELSVPYILARKNLLFQLIHAYDEKDVSISLACDAILRACIQCEPVAELMLQSAEPSPNVVAQTPSHAIPSDAEAHEGTGDMVLLFFRYLDLPTFINSHAFASFKLLLQLFPPLGAVYLQKHYTTFFPLFNRLLASENYLTKVQAFAFLGELLMERCNQEIMMRYVNEAENLKLAMMALRGSVHDRATLRCSSQS